MGTLRRNSQDQSEASLTSEAAEVLAAPDAHDSIAGDSAFVAAVKRQFLPGGTLSRATDGFVSRPGQVAFAESVARAIETHDTLVVEAGTGTGKTFAYLTPALMSDCRVIVSTAGKSLQDQLFGKDIPAVKRVLLNNADVALLKGRSNYLCKYRMDHAEFLPSPAAVQDLAAVKRFAQTTRTGDRNEIRGVAENSVIWPYVTSTNENCLGRRCPNAEECFVTRARNRARAAKIVVVNHHLFLSAVAAAAASDDTREAIEPLQPELVTGEELPALSDDAGDLIGHVDSDEGLLPHADVVIFDEAHKIPEIALSFFGEELATFAIKSVVEEMRGVLLSKFASYAPKESSWVAVCDVVTHALQDMMLALDIAGLAPETNVNLKDFTGDALKDAAAALEKALEGLTNLLKLCEPFLAANDDIAKHVETAGGLMPLISEWLERLKAPEEAKGSGTTPSVFWLERRRNEMRFVETPLTIADKFARLRAARSDAAWIFTSATIATENGNFSHFLSELGLTGATTHAWASPFAYEHQAMLYVPQNMPNPRSVERDVFIEALVRESWPVIDMLAGRTFFLCTSYRAMEHAAEVLRQTIIDNDRDYTVLVQNEDSRQHLIDTFRKKPNTILVATMSFWEGIDIKGEKLSLVVIDKLPFAAQGDPVLTARCKWIEEQGKNPFVEHQVPTAVIALKQGAGRLIRSELDRGILIVGDTRIIPGANAYARRFLLSLPPYVRTRRLERVLDFWRYPERAS